MKINEEKTRTPMSRREGKNKDLFSVSVDISHKE